MRATRPPVDYLANCSKSSLESLELSRLNVAANLRKQFHQVLSDLIENEVDARLARAILDWRRGQLSADNNLEVPLVACLEASAASRLPTPEQLSIAFEGPGAERAEPCRAQEIERETASTEAATSPLQTPEPSQAPQFHASRAPLLVRAAAVGGSAVQSLADSRVRGNFLRPRSALKRVMKWKPQKRAAAANLFGDALASNPNRGVLSDRANDTARVASSPLAPTLVCAAVTVETCFA